MYKINRLWGLYLGVLMWGVSAGTGTGAGTGGQAKLIGVLPKTSGGTDYQAYYDPVADLTWMADADVNGPMIWSGAKEWAAKLNIHGVTGWRLPEAPQPDPTCDTQIAGISRGFRCTGSEMGNLFYNVLGNVGYTDLCRASDKCPHSDGTLNNTGPFTNLQNDYYWTATSDPTDSESAMYFDFRFGDQREVNKLFPMYAWAVHSGNVGHAPVPGAKVPKTDTHAARIGSAKHKTGSSQ